MTLEAVIFSGAGSLVECGELDRRAWNSAFRTNGLDWALDWGDYAAARKAVENDSFVEAAANVLGRQVPYNARDVQIAREKTFTSMLSQDLPLRPGVSRVLSWCARAGVALGFVTRENTKTVRSLLSTTARERAGISFDVAVLADDVSELPPAPDAILKAIDELGVERAHTLAIVDTPTSAIAAQNASVPVLAFPGAVMRDDRSSFGALAQVDVLTPGEMTIAWREPFDTAAE